MSEPLLTPEGQAGRQPGESGDSLETTSGRRFHRLMRTLLFLIALLAGLTFQGPIARQVMRWVPDPNAGREILYWQSPMDPSFRSDKPGKTPMGMDLVPVYADEKPAPGPVTIAPEIQESEYTTAVIAEGPLVRSLETVSTVTFAEPLIGDITLKMEGWLEKLHVDYEGQTVKKGDWLLDVYAPELFVAEEEFLINLRYANSGGTSPSRNVLGNLESARSKLRNLDMTDEQIDQLARQGVVQKTLTYFSPYSGIVVKKNAFEGKAMSAGQLLYRIADLSTVWGDVFVYENQIHCVYEGQEATLTLTELPDRKFSGHISYIYPYLDPKSRTLKVRLEFENPDLMLMPGMFGHVKFEPHRMGKGLSVPRTAVMQTGTRNLVYLALGDNQFEARAIRTGMELDGDKLEVLDGLKAGERVVVSPNFLMDSESRVRLINRKFRPLPMPAGDNSSRGAMPGMSGHSMGSGTKESKDAGQRGSHSR